MNMMDILNVWPTYPLDTPGTPTPTILVPPASRCPLPTELKKHRRTKLPQFPEGDPALSHTGSVPASEASYRPLEAHGSGPGSPQSSRDGPISTTHPGEGVGDEPLDTMDLPPWPQDQGDSVPPPP